MCCVVRSRNLRSKQLCHGSHRDDRVSRAPPASTALFTHVVSRRQSNSDNSPLGALNGNVRPLPPAATHLAHLIALSARLMQPNTNLATLTPPAIPLVVIVMKSAVSPECNIHIIPLSWSSHASLQEKDDRIFASRDRFC